MENKYTKMAQDWADNPYVTHDDPTRCGQCYKEKIKSEVSKEFLAKNKINNVSDLKELTEEVEKRWKETELYKKVQDLRDQGHSVLAALEIMEKQGYLP